MALHLVTPRGPFSLAVSSTFLCGFTPASGTACAVEEGLALGFLADGDFEPAVASARQIGAEVHVEATHATHAGQLTRILSLDVDAGPLEAVAMRDPVVRGLVEARPGFRPTLFASAYEAAVWGILAQRMPMRVAAGLKRRLSEATVGPVTASGRTFHPAPPPRALLGLRAFPGLSAEKLERLQGVARAALDGALDTEALRAMPEDVALAGLERLRGIGPWTSRHVLLRGCGATDGLALVEPRLLRAVGHAYGLGRAATDREVSAIADAWRPLRTWVSILLVWSLADTPHWHGPEARGRVRLAS